MTFEQWVDENIKYIRTPDIFQWLFEAWEAGAKAECEKLKNVAIYDMWLKERDLSVDAAVLAEREACAKVCEDEIKSYMSKQYTTDPLGGYRERFAAEQCAAAIRARGE